MEEKTIRLIEPVQIFLVLIKLLEVLVFFRNIHYYQIRYRSIAWKNWPQIPKFLFISMLGWFTFITLDIIIFLVASLSFSTAPIGVYSGYDLNYASLFIANILRDFSSMGI